MAISEIEAKEIVQEGINQQDDLPENCFSRVKENAIANYRFVDVGYTNPEDKLFYLLVKIRINGNKELEVTSDRREELLQV